jgi:hypothetical protein
MRCGLLINPVDRRKDRSVNTRKLIGDLTPAPAGIADIAARDYALNASSSISSNCAKTNRIPLDGGFAGQGLW